MTSDDDRFRRDEDLLSRALREEGDRVLPSPDALGRIRRRTARPPLWRRPVVLGMAAASVTAVGVIAASAYVLGGSPADTTAAGPGASPAVTDSPTAVPSPSPSPSPSGTDRPPPATPSQQPGRETVPVYYVTTTPRGDRLAREFRSVPAPDGPLVAAVATMLAEPPLDPDYQSLWLADTEVKSVDLRADTIEVDLSGETDYTGMRNDVAELAVQQLVYTVTAAAADAGQNGALPVQILVDGVPAGQMWGQLDLSQPVARAPQLNVRLPVQINNPGEGAVVGRTVKIDGEAAVFEAHVDWQILDQGGTVVDSGFTMTTESGKFAPFSFEVELPPGSYTVVATESDPSGGEGPGPASDSRFFTVE